MAFVRRPGRIQEHVLALTREANPRDLRIKIPQYPSAIPSPCNVSILTRWLHLVSLSSPSHIEHLPCWKLLPVFILTSCTHGQCLGHDNALLGVILPPGPISQMIQEVARVLLVGPSLGSWLLLLAYLWTPTAFVKLWSGSGGEGHNSQSHAWWEKPSRSHVTEFNCQESLILCLAFQTAILFPYTDPPPPSNRHPLGSGSMLVGQQILKCCSLPAC